MSCCSQKKFYSELCEKCKLEIAESQQIQSDFPHYPDYDPPEGWEAAGQSVRCECGSDKSGGPGHSHWCPKDEGNK